MSTRQKNAGLAFMVLAIFIIALNLRPSISSIGPLLDVIRDDLQLTNSQVSLLTSIPVFCMGLFAPLAVPFNRRFGLKRSVTILIVMIGLFTLLRGFMPGFAVLAVSAFFIGLAIAIISPLLSAMIKQNFPFRATQLIGVYSFGMGLGAALASGLTAWFYHFSGWPAALALWAVLAAIALPVWFGVRLPKHETVEEETGDIAPAVSPWRSRRAWIMLLFFGFQSALFFSLITWLAPILIDKGLTILDAGAALTVMTSVQIVANLALPPLLGKWPNRSLWIGVGIAAGAVGLALLLLETTALVYVSATGLGISLGLLFPLALLMPIDEKDTAEEVNSWTAMIQSGGYIISASVPLAIGAAYDVTGSHQFTVMFLLVFAALLSVLTFLLRTNKFT